MHTLARWLRPPLGAGNGAGCGVSIVAAAAWGINPLCGSDGGASGEGGLDQRLRIVSECGKGRFQRAAGEEKFGPGGPKSASSLISERGVKLYRMLRNAANADAHTNSWRSESTIYGLLLLLLPLLLLLVCQQPFNCAPGTHRRPNSTRIVLARRFRDVLSVRSLCGAVCSPRLRGAFCA